MKPYEIRQIDGQDIFVKEIDSDFYLFNDTLVSVFPGYPMSDQRILSFLQRREDKVFPYGGAGKGEVLVVGTSGSDTVCSVFFLSEMIDQGRAELARRAYDEYKKWAGISD
jgi:hypothetical protein